MVGKRDVLELVLTALLADGHVLLNDVPGVAKTLMARSFATVCWLTFSRVQFTPDLLPADITGATMLDLATNSPVFRRGPIFARMLLADEVNRAPAKTQAALLEMAQLRGSRLNGAALLPLVRTGVQFKDGVHVERDDHREAKTLAEDAA